ncbi:MAG: hypothetical protein PVH61_19070 [Candidatus Aminicenantes bacterium]
MKDAAHKNDRVFVLNTSRFIQNPMVQQVILVNHNAKALEQLINKYRNKVRQVHYYGKLRDSLNFRTVIHDTESHPKTVKSIKSFCGGPGGDFLEKSPLAAGGRSNFRTGFKTVVKIFVAAKEDIIRHAKMLREQKCYICPQYPVEKIEDISLITSMGIAVDLLYQIDHMEKETILKILDMYLHHSSLDIPIEPFHSILVSKLKRTKLHLWNLHLMFPGGFFYVDDTGITEGMASPTYYGVSQKNKVSAGMNKKDYLFLIDWKSHEFKRVNGKNHNKNSLKKYFEAIPKKHPDCVSCEHFHFCFAWGKYKKDTCLLWKAILDKLQSNAKEIKHVMANKC